MQSDSNSEIISTLSLRHMFVAMQVNKTIKCNEFKPSYPCTGTKPSPLKRYTDTILAGQCRYYCWVGATVSLWL